MYFAVMDLGTNSVRLLIAKKNSSNVYLPCHSRVEITRLGEDTARDRRLKQEAVERTLEVMKSYLLDIKEYRAEITAVLGTSAVRESRNKECLISRLKNEVDIDLKVLSGKEEADLSYLGVVKSLREIENPLVFDLGGGSTELVWYQGGYLYLESLKLGVVRLTEACIFTDPPALQDVNAVQQYVRKTLTPLKSRLKGKFKELVGAGGTITSLAAVKQGLEIYDSRRVHGFVLSREEVRDLLTCLSSLKEEDRKKIPGLQPQRADVIAAGTAIVLTLMEELDFHRVTVSEGDLLLGALYKFN